MLSQPFYIALSVCSRLLEPTQKAARAHQLFPAIIALIDRKYLSRDLFSRVCQLLEFAMDECKSSLKALLSGS